MDHIISKYWYSQYIDSPILTQKDWYSVCTSTHTTLATGSRSFLWQPTTKLKWLRENHHLQHENTSSLITDYTKINVGTPGFKPTLYVTWGTGWISVHNTSVLHFNYLVHHFIKKYNFNMSKTYLNTSLWE